MFGEKLIACVVADQNQLNETQLIAFLRLHLESSKVPAEIHFMDDLPKGLSGKVQLKPLRARLTAHAEVSGTGSKMETQLLQAAAKAFAISVDQLGIHDNTTTVEGWDSMAHLEFITNLENLFKVRFTTADIMVMNSLQSAMDIVKRYNATS